MPEKLLIATRGEIAVRIIRAARELGIPTATVYTEDDRDSLHVLLADEAYPVSSYLSISDVVEAGLRSGSTLVHPGYGFLAESPEFAEAVERAGMVFVGPSPRVMRLAGDKVEAKKAAEAAGIEVLPWSRRPIMDAEDAVEIAKKLGFPVMVKAVAGGGGMGMRVARTPEELARMVEHAMIEAERAFGNPLVYVEKYLESPRHIEVQVLGDEAGGLVHLYERECSVQRRYQKIVEEAPSPALTPREREELAEKAVRLAERIGYTNAGTVEFLYKDGEFYFTEINARLQVEHGVTELVTGVDIVKTQILVAMGRELPFDQRDVKTKGWAFEARIYAENPFEGFQASPGRITFYHEPGGPWIRVDTGVYAGYTVNPHYNTLLLKVLAWGPSRAEALARMRRALAETVVGGVDTNIELLREVLADPDFEAGRAYVGMVEERLDRYRRAVERRLILRAVAAALASRTPTHGGRRLREKGVAPIWKYSPLLNMFMQGDGVEEY